MVGGVKGFILLLVVVMVGCGTTASWVSNPSNPNNVKIEAAIRKAANKPTGELTKADLEKVTQLKAGGTRSYKLTDVSDISTLENSILKFIGNQPGRERMALLQGQTR